MTELLDRTITKLKTLSVEQQDAIAMIILEELEDEIKWNTSFKRSQDVFAKPAKEAMSEYHAGKTQELDLETLWNQLLPQHFAKPMLSCPYK